VLGVRGLEEFGAFVVPINSDSGTKRRFMGSLLVMGWFPLSRFGRPRAAAAPMERSVVREARRAASWSAWL
jgi:hypothetical protein